MPRMIPIGEATELPLEIPDTSRLDQGLRGQQMQPARVPNGPSVNRTTFQGPQQPAGLRAPAAPVAPANPVQAALASEVRAPTTLGRAATGAGRIVGAGLRAFGPAAAGAGVISHFNDYKFNDPDVDSSAMGTLRAVGRGDFSGAGRSLQKGLAETGLDVGSAVANAADLFVPGKAPVSTAYNKFLRDKFGNQLVDNTPPALTSPAAPTANPATTSAAPAATPAPQTALTPADAGTPVPSNGTVAPNGIAVTPTLDASTQGALSAAQAAAAGRVDPGAPGANAISLGNGGAFGFDDKATRAAEVNAGERNYLLRQGLNSPNKGVRDISTQGIAAGDPTTVQNRATDSAERIAGLRERGETQRAIAANNLQRGIHADANNVALRGQDVSLAGHRMSNEVALANQRREQFNSDRAYNMDVAKYGTDVAEKNRAAGEAAQKTTQSQLENQFRTTDDKGNNVPDHAKIASYHSAVEQTLPQMVKELRATGNPEAIKKADEIELRRGAALTPTDHADLTQLFSRREQLMQTRSMLPGGAEARDSGNLLGFRQAQGAAGVQRNILTPNRVMFQNGASATPNDLSLRGGANAILPDFGKVRTDDLTRGLRTE